MERRTRAPAKLPMRQVARLAPQIEATKATWRSEPTSYGKQLAHFLPDPVSTRWKPKNGKCSTSERRGYFETGLPRTPPSNDCRSAYNG